MHPHKPAMPRKEFRSSVIPYEALGMGLSWMKSNLFIEEAEKFTYIGQPVEIFSHGAVRQARVR